MPALGRTFAALDELAAKTNPCPVPGLPTFADRHQVSFAGFRALAADGGDRTDWLDGWTRRHLDRLAELEAGWTAAVADGEGLLHSDLRADNLLVTGDGDVVIVDWPHACRGPGWVDKACMLPSVAVGGGPPPAAVEEALAPFGAVDHEALTLLVVALCGYFTRQGLEPDPPGLPTVRPFQRAQGDATRAWLRHRVRWS